MAKCFFSDKEPVSTNMPGFDSTTFSLTGEGQYKIGKN